MQGPAREPRSGIRGTTTPIWPPRSAPVMLRISSSSTPRSAFRSMCPWRSRTPGHVCEAAEGQPGRDLLAAVRERTDVQGACVRPSAHLQQPEPALLQQGHVPSQRGGSPDEQLDVHRHGKGAQKLSGTYSLPHDEMFSCGSAWPSTPTTSAPSSSCGAGAVSAKQQAQRTIIARRLRRVCGSCTTSRTRTTVCLPRRRPAAFRTTSAASRSNAMPWRSWVRGRSTMPSARSRAAAADQLRLGRGSDAEGAEESPGVMASTGLVIYKTPRHKSAAFWLARFDSVGPGAVLVGAYGVDMPERRHLERQAS